MVAADLFAGHTAFMGSAFALWSFAWRLAEHGDRAECIYGVKFRNSLLNCSTRSLIRSTKRRPFLHPVCRKPDQARKSLL